MKMRNYILLLFSIAFASYSATFSVDHLGISDHGDVTIPNSLAWYIATNGSGHTFKLEGNKSYLIEKTINVPANVDIIGENGSHIYCSDLLDDKPLIKVTGDNVSFNNLILDGNREAKNCVSASSRNNLKFVKCTFKNTKNDYNMFSSTTDSSAYLLSVNNSKIILVENCMLYNASCNPFKHKFDSSLINAKGSYIGRGVWSQGIFADGTDGLTVLNCKIEYTSAGGIGMAGAVNSMIVNNDIHHTALWPEETNCYPASQDAIIGYHSSTIMKNNVIMNNNITNFHNNGIHLAGEESFILKNRIIGGGRQGCSIAMGDQRDRFKDTCRYSYIMENILMNGNRDIFYVFHAENSIFSASSLLGFNRREDGTLPIINKYLPKGDTLIEEPFDQTRFEKGHKRIEELLNYLGSLELDFENIPWKNEDNTDVSFSFSDDYTSKGSFSLRVDMIGNDDIHTITTNYSFPGTYFPQDDQLTQISLDVYSPTKGSDAYLGNIQVRINFDPGLPTWTGQFEVYDYMVNNDFKTLSLVLPEEQSRLIKSAGGLISVTFSRSNPSGLVLYVDNLQVTSVAKEDTDKVNCHGLNFWNVSALTSYIGGTKVKAVDFQTNEEICYECIDGETAPWCKLSAYEPGDINGYWRQCWKIIGICE